MSPKQPNEDLYVDANGCLTERVTLDDLDVLVHYDDVPESDITTIDGVRVTTALRTVIDLAPELDSAELEDVVRHCLDRRLFTPDEARRRVSEPDMRRRHGARLVARLINDPRIAG